MQTSAQQKNMPLMPPKPVKLNPREEKFVQLVMDGRTATEAYLTAYDAHHLAHKSLNTAASRLIRTQKIKQRLSELRAEAEQRWSATVEKIEREYARIAFFDVRRLFHLDGTPKEVSELDEDTAAAIAGIEIEEIFEGTGMNRRKIGVVKKYKIADKLRALQDLGKFKGMFRDQGNVVNMVFQVKPPPEPDEAYDDEEGEVIDLSAETPQ